MTPFGNCLQKIRRKRKMRQKTVAALIGINRSYICALENGTKPPPSTSVVDSIIKNLALEAHEVSELVESIEISRKTLHLPDGMIEEEYKLAYELLSELGSMSHEKAAFMRQTLKMT